MAPDPAARVATGARPRAAPGPPPPPQPVPPVNPGGDRFTPGGRQGTGGGSDPLAGEPGARGEQRPHQDETAPGATSEGHPTPPDPTAGELDLPPPGADAPIRTQADFAGDVAEVHGFWGRFLQFTDAQLAARYRQLAEQVRSGKRSVADVAPECTALVCEVSRRTGKEPRQDQIAAATALVRGDVVEMR